MEVCYKKKRWITTHNINIFEFSLQNFRKYQPSCSWACACEWNENIISLLSVMLCKNMMSGLNNSNGTKCYKMVLIKMYKILCIFLLFYSTYICSSPESTAQTEEHNKRQTWFHLCKNIRNYCFSQHCNLVRWNRPNIFHSN